MVKVWWAPPRHDDSVGSGLDYCQREHPMVERDKNPYAAPAPVGGQVVPMSSRPVASRWLTVGLALAFFGYAGISMLLISSTPMDRFYGYFYLPVLFMLAILYLAVHFHWAYLRSIAILTALMQCCLASWLLWLHPMHMPAFFLAILPTIVIIVLSFLSARWILKEPGNV
ncbi:hypothetical protein SH139x_002298 [Planctomycetaceae bacterium SH139]